MAGAGSGDSSLKQRPLQAKPFSPVARKIRIGRVPLLRQDEQRKHPRADRRRADKAEHGALGEYSEVAVRHRGTLHASILLPVPYGLRLLSLSKRRPVKYCQEESSFIGLFPVTGPVKAPIPLNTVRKSPR